MVIRYCHSCLLPKVAEWPHGPDGPHTLCEVCGSYYAKLVIKRELLRRSDLSAKVPPALDIGLLHMFARLRAQTSPLAYSMPCLLTLPLNHVLALTYISVGHHSATTKNRKLVTYGPELPPISPDDGWEICDYPEDIIPLSRDSGSIVISMGVSTVLVPFSDAFAGVRSYACAFWS
ncbi:GATA zinc finger protein [Rhizoctonia solani AG-3 Rhs1AP]|uniref:GATA zinc finger protein n=2 Tax=Rhizoctonia solani AG-3 TaxID=1086053 RepID=A0A074RIJ5_9AGAM|nr:GATA zinc finger protein [Rhizoctonia solani AG-3 Rhs1AP]KEP45205.1 GATA zinc finger protein [Rhizoctonia solani 123E]